MNRLENKIALVTGGNSGIGQAIAIEMAKEGATVVVSDLANSDTQETMAQVHQYSPDSIFLPIDVSDEQNVIAGIEELVAKFGRLDIAVNNAGVDAPSAQIHEIETKDWNRVIGINLNGQFYCTKHQLKQFLKQGGGTIVAVASLAGLLTIPGQLAYVCSKHGTLGLVKTVAAEYGQQNIRANAICPYYIATNMTAGADDEVRKLWLEDTPMHRLGELKEVAQAAVFYASDESGYCNGNALVLDGGKHIK
ncbi:SDR family NAD(P)-dependent oxidoreductase [Kangiella sp. TOML190]|uniref:SDR family NAD(P)-dependent oxidoreductase n=1 Tax=Kangiella sp. TOML190 TaxID=2931351 RepID=UPI00203C7841|nr:SDR family NAD(P)-dependent oxidoreductase [Kangiella sp. TOML190]